MPASPDGNHHPVGGAKADAAGNVRRVGAADDGERAPVDHAVVDGTGGVIPGIRWGDKCSAQLRGEFGERPLQPLDGPGRQILD